MRGIFVLYILIISNKWLLFGGLFDRLFLWGVDGLMGLDEEVNEWMNGWGIN